MAQYSQEEARKRVAMKRTLRKVGIPFQNDDPTPSLLGKFAMVKHAHSHPWTWCGLSDVPARLRWTPGFGYDVEAFEVVSHE